MLTAPIMLAVPASPYANCLGDSGASGAGSRTRASGTQASDGAIAAWMAEAKVWPLRALEPGDDLLPASMPDVFKPQVIVVTATVGTNGRVADCVVQRPSKFDVLNAASCAVVRQHYVPGQLAGSGKQKIAIAWTGRTVDPARRICSDPNGTVPIAMSLWATFADLRATRLQNGRAVVALDVDPKGGADRCVILASNLPEDLQSRLCRVVVQRATILPAIDAQGTPIAARMTLTVNLGK